MESGKGFLVTNQVVNLSSLRKNPVSLTSSKASFHLSKIRRPKLEAGWKIRRFGSLRIRFLSFCSEDQLMVWGGLGWFGVVWSGLDSWDL